MNFDSIDQFIINARNSQNDAYDKRQAANDSSRFVNMSKTAAGGAATGTLNSGRTDALNVQYDAVEYLPNWVKNFEQNQTILEKINSNATDTWNQVKAYQEAIDKMNGMYR